MSLRTRSLKVGYGKRVVVEDIDLEVLRGRFVGLLGPNGCGKSTILKTFAKILAPLGGTVYLGKRDLRRIGQGELARRMAVVLTGTPSPGLLTTFDIAAMGRYPHTGFLGRLGKEDIEKIWEALRTVGASELAHRYFGELSDGEKQKVLLARALAQEPEIIILDEPTSHLDPRYRIEVVLILRRLVREKGVTIVASLHDIDLAMKVCDIVVLVKDGRVLACGPPEEVLEEERIAELYNFERASFNSFLGGIELKSRSMGPVYVVAGSGSGAQLYRTLAKHDFGIFTGVLPENDVDFHVARAVGATVVKEKPYREISPESFSQASELMKESHQVVDAGFPVGEANRRNLELVLGALRQGKVTYALRNEEESRRLYGPHASRIIRSRNISSLIERLRAVECLCEGGGSS